MTITGFIIILKYETTKMACIVTFPKNLVVDKHKLILFVTVIFSQAHVFISYHFLFIDFSLLNSANSSCCYGVYVIFKLCKHIFITFLRIFIVFTESVCIYFLI